MASLYDAKKGVWNVHKRLILWCSLLQKIQNWVAVSGAHFYSSSKACSPCWGCLAVFSIHVFAALLFCSCHVPNTGTQQRERAGPQTVSSVFLHEHVILHENVTLSAELPHWELAASFCSALPGKCTKCATVATEMLREAEMTCSFEKQWHEG